MNRHYVLRVANIICKNTVSVQRKQSASSLSILCNENNQTDYAKQRTQFVVKSDNVHQTSKRYYVNFNRSKTLCQISDLLDQRETYKFSKRHAGHSHWHNIQHVKGAKDKQRGLVATQMMNRVRAAIRDGGSADPKVNSELAKAIENAKAKSVPNETIQRALKAAEAFSNAGKEEIVEGTGVGGMMIIVQCYTDKPQKARMDVQSKLKRYGATIGNAGVALHSFERKGIVEIELEEGDSRNHDDHIEIALEAEAEDVSMETRDEGKDVLQFQCDHLQLSNVKKCLAEKGKNIIYAESVFIPLTTLPLPEEAVDSIGQLIEKLKELDHVEDVFTNVVLES